MQRSKRAGFALLELLVVIIIIGMVTMIGGVPLFLSPSGNNDAHSVALLVSGMSTKIQGWAIESGSVSIMEIDLSAGTLSFFELDSEGERRDIEENSFRSRTLGSDISFLNAQFTGHTRDEGKIYIPYYPTGISEKGVLYLQDKQNEQIWTLYFKKFYGEVDIFEGEKTLEELLDIQQ